MRVVTPNEIVKLAHRYFTQLEILGIEDDADTWLWFVTQYGIEKTSAARVRKAIDTIQEATP